MPIYMNFMARILVDRKQTHKQMVKSKIHRMNEIIEKHKRECYDEDIEFFFYMHSMC